MANEAGAEEDVVLLIDARRELKELSALLEVAPFSPDVVKAMHTYLAKAEPVRDAFHRFCALPSGTLRSAIGELR
ncbi:hypothetical protein G3I34_04250 [Streptomyces sp. SID8014]|uniref:hypothetical protein n=1 Tax=Streptomyces TaxID=1883 RepID=UPI0013B9CAD6|nr:hypothetical protein [Streptomyces sp. SID8014]NEC11529.1 hypothetical protein [Streptomyces sp. SID8014]